MFNYTATLSAAETWAHIIPRHPVRHHTNFDWFFEPVVQPTDGAIKLTLNVPGKPAKTRDVSIADIRDAANVRGSVINVLDDIYLNMFASCGVPAPPLPVRG